MAFETFDSFEGTLGKCCKSAELMTPSTRKCRFCYISFYFDGLKWLVKCFLRWKVKPRGSCNQSSAAAHELTEMNPIWIQLQSNCTKSDLNKENSFETNQVANKDAIWNEMGRNGTKWAALIGCQINNWNEQQMATFTAAIVELAVPINARTFQISKCPLRWLKSNVSYLDGFLEFLIAIGLVLIAIYWWILRGFPFLLMNELFFI